MIRIAFLIRSLDRGGTERQLANLVRTLDRDRFDATVITFYSGGYFQKELEDAGVRLICLHKRGRWEVLRFLWRLVGELRRLHPGILHSYLVEPNLVAVLLKPFFRHMKVVWGMRASDMDLAKYDWFARLNFRLECLASRFAELIIVNSEAGRAYHVARGFPEHKSIVIHGGVDLERFGSDRESGKQIRAAWKIADDIVLIGLVGRLDPMKDHPTFLKAAKLLCRGRSDVRFVCVGTGPEDYAAVLRRLADEYGISDRLIWAGARDNMPAVYNALDIACSSSAFGEGLSNVICEAMACDLPCVVTDVGDAALLVGNMGIVVPPKDPRALADGLTECLNKMALGQPPNPRSRIEEHFGISQFKNETQEALAQLIAHENV